jgi:hypothetical protein
MSRYDCANPRCKFSFSTHKKMAAHYFKTSCAKSVAATKQLLKLLASESAVVCPPVADSASLAPRVCQPQSSLLAKGRSPPRNTTLPESQSPVSYKKQMIQHGGGHEPVVACLPALGEGFTVDHDDQQDAIDFPPLLPIEDATGEEEELAPINPARK